MAICSRFRWIERTTVLSAVLVINIFSITDSADHNNTTLHIKQDAIVAHAQAIHSLGFVQPFDVALQAELETFDLAQHLCAFAGRQAVEVLQRRSTVFNLETMTVRLS